GVIERRASRPAAAGAEIAPKEGPTRPQRWLVRTQGHRSMNLGSVTDVPRGVSATGAIWPDDPRRPDDHTKGGGSKGGGSPGGVSKGGSWPGGGSTTGGGSSRGGSTTGGGSSRGGSTTGG